jgi:hypothetical protein
MLPAGNEKNDEKPPLGEPVSEPRFEHWTSRTQTTWQSSSLTINTTHVKEILVSWLFNKDVSQKNHFYQVKISLSQGDKYEDGCLVGC